MKIYNTRDFIAGTGLILLGLINVYFQFTGSVDTGTTLIRDWVIIAACTFTGATMITRSLSHRATHDDHLENHDERNQLIRLKANDRTLKILVGTLALGALTTAIMTFHTASAVTRGVLSGAGLTLGLTFWIWLGSTIYYEHKL